VYKLVGPSPAKDYLGEVVLTPNAAGGTDIRWSGSFVERIRGTGPATRAALGGAVKLLADRLVEAAERQGVVACCSVSCACCMSCSNCCCAASFCCSACCSDISNCCWLSCCCS